MNNNQLSHDITHLRHENRHLGQQLHDLRHYVAMLQHVREAGKNVDPMDEHLVWWLRQAFNHTMDLLGAKKATLYLIDPITCQPSYTILYHSDEAETPLEGLIHATMPLIGQHQMLGAVEILSYQDVDHWHQNLLELFCASAGSALAHAHKFTAEALAS